MEKGVAEYEIVRVIDSVDMSLRKLWKITEDREGWHAIVYEVPKSWT